MRLTSTRWDDAVLQFQQLVVRVTVLKDGDEAEILEDAVSAGSVTLDQTAAVRGRCDITVAGLAEYVPSEPTDLLAPYGAEIKIERGVRYANGDEELVSLGIFRIESAEINDSGEDLEVRISGLDRSARIIDAAFEEPFDVAEGTNFRQAILDIISDVYPDLDHDLAPTGRNTPAAQAAEGDDRWAFCQEMAAAIGMQLYFDGDGVLILRPVDSDVNQTNPYELIEGEDGVLLEASRNWTREGSFNKVIVTGENTTDGAFRGEAADENENSPTYYFGPFGQVPIWHTSPFVTSDDQAEEAARGMLQRELGATQRVSFGTIVNPALEPGDAVRLVRERAGISEVNVIDTLTIPLEHGGTMTGTTRATTE